MKKIFPYLILIVAILVLTYLIVKAIRKKKQEQHDAERTIYTNEGEPIDQYLLLSIGSRGAEVRELQRILGVNIDGIFGEQTQAALINQTGIAQITLYSLMQLMNEPASFYGYTVTGTDSTGHE